MICILKTHWVLGGAERYLADLSSALTDLGHAVTLASLDGVPRRTVLLDMLARSQAVGLEHWPLEPKALGRRSGTYDVFISAVPSLVLRPRAGDNWLVVFSPGSPRPNSLRDNMRWGLGAAARRAIDVLAINGVRVGWNSRLAFHPYRAPRYAVRPYNHVVAISNFVARGVREYWMRDAELLYPSIDIPQAVSSGARPKLILSVGRFLPSGNQKNHRTLIEAFRLLYHADNGWQLILVGGFEGSASEMEYLKELENAARHLPVEFIPNADEGCLLDLLGQAAFLWHAAGIFSAPYDYLNVEQFGIAVAQAAAHGVVPLVFPAGGVPEIVPLQQFHWRQPDELVERTREIFADLSLWSTMSETARTSAERFTKEVFHERVRELVYPAALQ